MNKKEVKDKLETELKIQGKSMRTQKMYWFFNEKFLDFIKKDPEQIIEQDIKLFLTYLISDKQYDPSSVALARSSITFFYDEVLKKKLTIDIKTPKKQRKIPEVLTKEEIKIILDSIKNLKSKLLIELMYSSGLRVAECASLKISDLNLEDKTGLLKRGKGGKDRFFILSEQVIKDIKTYLERRTFDSEYLFPGSNGCITTRAIQKTVQRIAKKAKIRKHIHCHGFRHAFATHLLESGIDIRKIQELLAHSNLQTTQFYTNVSTKELKKVKSPLDDIT